MAIGQNGAVVRQINRLFESGTVAGLSESELLDRFVVRRDEAAFEAIVVRHGPMVLGVCRRSLSDPNDVDDAFQATFLVLVRKAATLRDRTRLANWLYGVARQVSIKARANALKRRQREGGIDAAAELPDRRTAEHPLKSVLDEELARLSAKDRAPIVLCDLEGLTGDEAADVLGLRPVTLRSRLHRSRMKLKDRLARRGLDYGAGAPMVAGAIPSMLAEQTVKAAVTFATGPMAVGAISASVVALTQGVLKTMTFTKMKTAAAMLVALGLVGTGVGVAQDPAPARNPKDDDRLRQVESKLDRVLQALENRPSAPRPAEGRTSSDAVSEQLKDLGRTLPGGANAPGGLPPSADVPQSKYTDFRPSPTANFPGGSIVPIDPVTGHVFYPPARPLTQEEIDRSTEFLAKRTPEEIQRSTAALAEMKARARYGIVTQDTPANRLTRLEMKFEELEQRIKRLEGGMTGNHLPTPATTLPLPTPK